ncbi:hypothetical protein [Actinacidiphila sp. ITFR-21]|uniref:hypothetical protein n=1 Tax=Actinacidiphila sp. ITFR-21 TaxID=3075199 RepID=UPI00288C5000|nr:hypothetical protein [Streptomyces sp. ITFR-21]WNI15940.1 hypothetical protein RLT57_10690 [Streptomyces sp. ITFR-21]
MARSILGCLLALAGASAAVWGAFQPWYGGRRGADIRVDDLFTRVGVTAHDAAPLGSLFLPMGFAALLTLLGALMRSRYVVALAGVLVLGTTVLWMVRQAQFSRSLTAGGDGLGTGVAGAVGGGLLLFLAARLVGGRPPRLRRAAFTEPAALPYDGGGGYDTLCPGRYPYGPDAPPLPPAGEAEPTLVGEPPGIGGPPDCGPPTVRGGAPPAPPPHRPGGPPPPPEPGGGHGER